MSLHRRVERLSGRLARAGREPEPAFLVVWEPAAPGRTDCRPPGIYPRAGVVEVVYAGEAPSPAVQARVRELTTPTPLEIELGPDVVEPPG